MDNDFRVLSIQSHVVRGYVGNKSACFPLQVLGFEVDAINSVQLSNHTKYNHFRGQILNSEQLEDVFDGIRKNDLIQYTQLLTGYCSSESFLNKLADIVKEVKDANPELIYLCDPVMGDNGRMYVPKELLPLYKEKLLPLADIITPNQFEAEILTGVKITSDEKALEAIQILHNLGVETVIISSYKASTDAPMICLGSVMKDGKQIERVKIEIPELSSPFTGTGDVFSALFLGWFSLTCKDLKTAIEKTINTIQAILKSTLKHAQSIKSDAQPSSKVEMRLIQNKRSIEDPAILIKAITF